MCYEEGFFMQRTVKKARAREEPRSVIERQRPSPQADRPTPETRQPKEAETELETV